MCLHNPQKGVHIKYSSTGWGYDSLLLPPARSLSIYNELGVMAVWLHDHTLFPLTKLSNKVVSSFYYEECVCFSSNISFCGYERSKGKLRETERRWHWRGGWRGDCWVGDETTSCWFVQFNWSHEEKVTGDKCLLMHTVWTADLVSACTNTHRYQGVRPSRAERAARQMTRQHDCCLGDGKHDWPKPRPQE